ncbi:MAG: LacI family DNA-binding transcriptional regulator [Opitutaceae bacterium]|nr:LacI family DNA-binding transcriptional regulator [Opitutaceae bacterium]
MNRRPTIKDIATLTGVHHSTVSLALRNHPSIPEATRARIRAAAQKIGYRPDPMLASLMSYRRSQQPSQRRPVVAWVTNFPTRARWRQTRVFLDCYNAAVTRADQLGFRIEEFWLREGGMSSHRARQILATRNISALLLAPQPQPGMKLELDWPAYSAVTLGYTLIEPRLHLVSNHQFVSMILLFQKLQELGYRRIGLALPLDMDLRVHHGWLGGFLAEQVSQPRTQRIQPWIFQDYSRNALAVWLKRARPEVVITPTERIWDDVAALGYRVPADLGLAHPSVTAPDGGRSGIDENAREIGTAAMDLLASLWQHNDRGIPAEPRRLLIEGRWLPGATVRAPT